MPRKRQKSVADELVDMFSLFPWWVSLVAALLVFVGLGMIANQPVGTPSGTHQPISNVISGALTKSMVGVGQYVIPFVLLVAAVISFVRQRKSASLIAAATGPSAADAISGMSWREFELLIAEAFRRKGFEVKDKGGQGPDGGVDLVLIKGKERFLVQCKQWRALKVSVSVVRELYGVMSAEGAAGGFVVTSGSFTEDAQDFALGRNIKLIDGPLLLQLLETGRKAKPGPAKAQVSAPELRSLPACPKCGADMVVREARKGPSAGNKFWGCSRFPDCRGTSPL